MSDDNILTFATLESFKTLTSDDQNNLVYQTLEISNQTLENNVVTDDQKETITDLDDKSTHKSSPIKEIHICNICNYQTESKGLLQRHVKLHNVKKPFKCPHCEREFRDSIQLTNHVNIHLGYKPYRCDHCDLSFTTRGELNRHTQYRHTLEKKHKCPQCDYASVELSKLKRHIRTHTGEKPYLCPHCDYASRDTFKLKRHIRVHTGEKPYECPICHNRFTQSNSLKSHLMVHRHAPVCFKCKYCALKYTTKGDLDSHIKAKHKEGDDIVVPDAPDIQGANSYVDEIEILQKHQQQIESQVTTWFSCNECSMKFSTKETFENHKIRHTGERPYQCHICAISFGQTFALRAHINSHNRGNAEAKNNSNSEITNQTLQKDDLLVMNKLQEIIDNVVEIVNPIENESFDKIPSTILIFNSYPLQTDEEIIKDLMNSMINKVVDMSNENENKLKPSSIARLLGSAPVKSVNLDFLTPRIVYPLSDFQTNIPPVVSNETMKLPITIPAMDIPTITTDNAAVVPSFVDPFPVVPAFKVNTVNQVLINPPIVAANNEAIEEKLDIQVLKVTNVENKTTTVNDLNLENAKKDIKTLEKKITPTKDKKSNKKEGTKKADPYGINCKLCSAIFRTPANLARHLKKNHKAQNIESSNSTQDRNRHEFFLSHLNETALNQNYTGISKSQELKLNRTNSSNKINGDNDKTSDAVNNDKSEANGDREDTIDSSNVANIMDQELLFSRNETYSELVKDITVLQKNSKKRTSTTPKKSPKQPNLQRNDKSSAHLAPTLSKSTEDISINDNTKPNDPKTSSPAKNSRKRVRKETNETSTIPTKITKTTKKKSKKKQDDDDDDTAVTSQNNSIVQAPPEVILPTNDKVKNKREASKRAKLNISNIMNDSEDFN